MGLGSRDARRHHSAAAERTAGSGNPSWAFAPGQGVMTVDGFSGSVTAVNEGPGGESYQVTLDGEMGGGEYTASQLSPKTEAGQYTASADYPELAEVLVQRPDIAPNTRWATMSATAGRDEDDWSDDYQQCPECSQMVNTERSSMLDHLRDEHGANPDNYAKSAGSAWEKTAGVDSEPCACTDSATLPPHTRGQHYDVRQQADDALRNSGTCQSCGGGDHTTGEHMGWAERKHAEGTHDAWGRPLMQPYDGHGAWACNNYGCTEHPDSMYPKDGEQLQGPPGWLTHDAGPDADMRREVNKVMSPKDTQDANWLLSQQSDGPTKYSMLQSQAVGPKQPPSEWNQHHPQPDDEHTHQNMGEFLSCPKCSNDLDALKPTEDEEHNADARKDVDDVFAGPEFKDAGWLLDQQHTGPTKYSALWGIVTTAAGDSDFRFEVTAAWSDVRNKAKRIRATGGVNVTLATSGIIVGEVQGDHNVYESGIQRMPGRTAIQAWSCGCKWGAYHWGADDDFSRFAGRMCSHALALQYEAQSRGMFGRDIKADTSKPTWTKRMVVVKHDIDGRRDVSAPATALSALETVTGALVSALRGTEPFEDVALAFTAAGLSIQAALRTEAAVNDAWGEPSPAQVQYTPGPTKPSDPTENPASAGWASAPEPDSWSEAGPSGLNHLVSSAETTECPECVVHEFNDDDDEIVGRHQGPGCYGCGGTGRVPKDKTWGLPAGGHPTMQDVLDARKAALDDDAIFEPEMPKEGFAFLLPLLAPLLEGAGAAAAGAGAAEVGAGAAGLAAGAGEAAAGAGAAGAAGAGAGAAGAGEAAGGGLLRSLGPKVLQNEVVKKLLPGDDEKGPERPKQPGPFHPTEQTNRSVNTGVGIQHVNATLDPQPEGALPFTDGADDDLYGAAGDPRSPDSLEPDDIGFASTGSVSDIVAQFQATAGAKALGDGGAATDSSDIAAAARAFLETGQMPIQTTALKDFTLTEQRQIIDEGQGVTAANLDRLDLRGTHYEPLEAALAAADNDEEWMS